MYVAETEMIRGHSFGDWLPDGDATYHVRECCCGEKDKADHIFNNGVVVAEPTYLADGVKAYVCGICGATITEIIPKLEKKKGCLSFNTTELILLTSFACVPAGVFMKRR